MTEEQIQKILDDLIAAVSIIAIGGQSYTITTMGSSTRTVENADLDDVNKWIAKYNGMLKDVQGESGFTMNAGW